MSHWLVRLGSKVLKVKLDSRANEVRKDQLVPKGQRATKATKGRLVQRVTLDHRGCKVALAPKAKLA